MVVSDTRDHRKDWFYNIGSIESSSYTHLYDTVFASLVTKIEKCKNCAFFKIREVISIFDNLFRIPHKISCCYESSIGFKSLSDIYQVWACKDSYFFSWFFQYLKYHLWDTPLSIGSSYMDASICILWISKVFTGFLDFFKSVGSYFFSMEKSCKNFTIFLRNVAHRFQKV